MLKRLLVPVVLGVLAAAPPSQVQAQTEAPGYNEQTPKELFEGATRMMMQALDLLIKTMPQYEAPVVLDNGDILIRRKRPENEAPPPGERSSPDQDRI